MYQNVLKRFSVVVSSDGVIGLLIALTKSLSTIEHLTSQFSWVAAWLLVTCVCPVYQVEELVLLVFNVSL